MNKKVAAYLYFAAGILFLLTSIINFIAGKMTFGVTYLCLAITFIVLGIIYRKK